MHVSCPHSSELPCKILRKSLERFLRNIGNQQNPARNSITNGSDSMGPGAGPKSVKTNYGKYENFCDRLTDRLTSEVKDDYFSLNKCKRDESEI